MEVLDQEKVKRPPFLTVLCVLSFAYILFSIMGLVMSLTNGPLPQEILEEQTAQYYTMYSELEEKGVEVSDHLKNSINVLVANTKYVNNEVFYANKTLNLIASLLGLIGVYLMFNLRKVGFHFYLVYSLLPVIIMYILLPIELILTLSIVVSLVLSALFAVLYGLNLKLMK